MKNPEIEFVRAIEDYNHVMICIKGSPDPDALASAFVVKLLCEKHGKKARIVATQRLSLSQNRLFAKRLSLSFELADSFTRFLGWADCYAIVDHASPEIEGVSQKLPCIVHIDHHEKVKVSQTIKMRWCRTDVGSASTMMSQILEKSHGGLSVSSKEMERMATALLFGIQTDTDKYALATKADYLAIEFLTQFADASFLRKLSGVPLSRATVSRLKLAQSNKAFYRGWLLTGIGLVPEKNRDDIAIIADYLLRREDVALVIVFALIHNERKKKLTLDASLRSFDKGLKLSSLIRRIATNGGGRKFKGAFQVNLDYFSSFSDKQYVWESVEKITVEKLKRARDSNYKVKIQGMFENAKGSVFDLFSGVQGAVSFTKSNMAAIYQRNKTRILHRDIGS